MPNKILINFAHPSFEISKANQAMLSALQGVDGVTINDLYEQYPDFLIDKEREQELLLEHDVIVFQHPFFWYSMPALLKEWQDVVLEYGFAYGAGGNLLRDKYWQIATTAVGTESSYCEDGSNGATIEQLLAPIQQTANFCGMRYLPPFVIYDVLRISEQALVDAAEDYRQDIIQLQNHMDYQTGEIS